MFKAFPYCLLLMVLLAASCRDHEDASSQTVSGTGKQAARAPDSMSSRRFSGTVGHKPVVLYLQHSGERLHGVYYVPSGQKYELMSLDDSSALADGAWLLYERPANATDTITVYWRLRLAGGRAEGYRASADTMAVALHEDYPAGSYWFRVAVLQDSARLYDGQPQPAATTRCEYVRAGAGLDQAQAAFMEQAWKQVLNCSPDPETSLAQCLNHRNEIYFDDYRQMLGALSFRDSTAALSPMNNFFSQDYIRVIYNADDWLMAEHLNSEYTGGAHSQSASEMLCLDLRGRRQWLLADMLAIDTPVLSALLDASARQYFGIPDNEPLENRLLVDRMPLTDNVFLTGKGLYFVYNTYEVASYADGKIELFIPYHYLGSMLQPALRQRLGAAAPATQAGAVPVRGRS
jgi:hypothetical protein